MANISEMATYNFFILCFFIVSSKGVTQQLHLKKLSSAENNLDALVCAIDKFSNEESLATRYDPTVETCEGIPVSEVNAGDAQKVFYKLRAIALSTADKDRSFTLLSPSTIGVGWAFIFDIETGNVYDYSSGTSFAIDLEKQNRDQGWYLCFHFSVRYQDNQIVLGANRNNKWMSEDTLENAMPLPYTKYKLEFRVEASVLKIYIDDRHIHDYNFRFDISQTCDMVSFKMGNDVDVLKVERIYPA